MATFDPNIVLQARPVQDPMESYGKALTLRGLGQQQKMQEAQFAKLERDQADEMALADLYRGSVDPTGKVDRNALLSGAASRGLGARIPGLQKGFADQDKASAESQKMSIERQAAGAKLIGDTMSQLASIPNLTHEQVIRVLAQMPGDVVDPAKTAEIVRMLPPDPQRLRQTLIQYGMSADERYKALAPKVENLNLGNRVQPGTQDPTTGAFTPSGPALTKAPEGFIVGPDGRLTADPGFLRAKSQIAAAGRPSINVNTEKTLTGNIAGKLADQLDSGLAAASSAVDSIQSARNLKQILSSGKVITGPGADARIVMTQIGSALGLTGKDAEETLTNTRQVVQALAAGELEAAKGMKGQGAMSDAERALLKRVAGGDINMTAGELKTLANAIERSATTRVRSHQGNVERLRNVPGAESLIPFYQAPEVPPAQQPPQPAPAVQSWKSAGYASEAQAVQDALGAISQGADKAAVIQRLEAAGIKNHGIR
jgi:hypothetical protein